MRKPCTDCPHFKKTQITSIYSGRKSTSGTCMAGRLPGWPNTPVALGYYEMIANCVDYAEWLAWQRQHRKRPKMRNGITIDGIEYKTVRANNPLNTINSCDRCDLKKICERKNCQYPCELFAQRYHAVYFKKRKT